MNAELATEYLLVFAKYPEPGRCKTRMVSRLGNVGAAELQREMTQHTLNWASQLRSERAVQVQVHFAGGTEADMQLLFGESWQYLPQANGSLGMRLATACLALLNANLSPYMSAQRGRASNAGTASASLSNEPTPAPELRVVIVGTDCPDLSPAIVSDAFERLNQHDACFVPALDGGYTLVAFNLPRTDGAGDMVAEGHAPSALLQALFADDEPAIDWGSDRVLSQTLRRLTNAGLSTALLPPLPDVDRPNDLEVWERASSANKRLGGKNTGDKPLARETEVDLSVVIPVYDHEPALLRTLESVGAAADGSASAPNIEAIVCAAGESHQTVLDVAKFTRRFPVQLLACPPGRGAQLNCGAAEARGRRLLFLHADTQLPSGYWTSMNEVLNAEGVALGAFQLRIDSASAVARIIERGVSLRSLLGLPYGDQGLFMPRRTFDQLGGFRLMPIMEDYEFVRRARKVGRIGLAKQSVVTSARRWEKLGSARTTAINQFMLVGYHLGISPERLAAFYRRKR